MAANNAFPPLRGVGHHRGYSGQIRLTWDGTITFKGKEEIKGMCAGCVASVRPRNYVRYLTVHGDETFIDEAVDMAMEK